MAFVDGENGENFMTEIFGFTQFSRSDNFKQVKDLNKFGMDYEKRYKEALDRMKSWVKGEHPECFSEAQKAAEFVFPELKESEDERIRKDCIKYLDWEYQHCSFNEDKMKIEKCIAWLEKQDEQKPTDKTELKFNIGDWIVGNDGTFKITRYEEEYGYELTGTTGYVAHFISPDYVESNFHLWTINDAKDGDVLVNGSNIFIFHFLNDTRLMGYCHVNTNDGRFYDDIGKNECFCLIDAIVTPATKEQRELLFEKMTQAGWKWNSEEKELKKISPKTLDPDKVIEWLKNEFDDSTYGKAMIEQFKKDCGL